MAGRAAPPTVYLLRAVNVGKAKVPMPWLRETAEDLGATDVATYVNSGNLVCTPPAGAGAFGTALEQRILDELDVTTDAIARTGAELRAALESYPFDIHEARFCHIWFLVDQPTDAAVTAVESYDVAPDRLRVLGRDVHVRYENGVAGTRITAPRMHRLCGSPGTGRNLRTVEKLAEMAGA